MHKTIMKILAFWWRKSLVYSKHKIDILFVEPPATSYNWFEPSLASLGTIFFPIPELLQIANVYISLKFWVVYVILSQMCSAKSWN